MPVDQVRRQSHAARAPDRGRFLRVRHTAVPRLGCAAAGRARLRAGAVSRGTLHRWTQLSPRPSHRLGRYSTRPHLVGPPKRAVTAILSLAALAHDNVEEPAHWSRGDLDEAQRI